MQINQSGTWVGNDACNRTYVDGATNQFYVDQQQAIPSDGYVTAFRIFAKTTNPVQLILYRKAGNSFTVVGKSDVQAPVVGANEFFLKAPIAVNRGDLVGFHTPGGAGTIAYDRTGPDVRDELSARVGIAAEAGGQLQSWRSSERVYSIQVRVECGALRPAGSQRSGKVVVNADEWTLSNAGFARGPDARPFAQNVANWFAGGRPGKFLIYSSNFGLTESAFHQTLKEAGHAITCDSNVKFTLDTLLNYDGVFLAGNAADNTVVAEYVNQGGCVYLAAGTGWEGAAAEAERWNKFLGTVGMKLEPIYEGFEGRFECRYEHPVFLGVQSLYYCGGNPVFTTSAAQSGSQIIARSPQGKGTIGIFDASLSAAHIEREKAEREKAEREKAEREKAEREKAEREKAEREKAEREKAEREKAERENKLAELNQIISEQKKKIADQDEKLKKCADCEQKLAEQEQKIAEQEKKIAELKAKPTIPAKPDNLTIIEGIGPKISELLAKEGITSFQQLASTSGDRLKAILATDKNMRLADPTTWPEQARLAAEGRKDELAALQSKLRGGRG